MSDPTEDVTWFDLGALDALPLDQPTARMAGTVPLVVLRRGPDALLAFLDACPHRGVPLSETGRVLEDTLVCSVHFWRFTLPEGRQTHLPDICLQRWPTRVTPDGRVEVRAPSVP